MEPLPFDISDLSEDGLCFYSTEDLQAIVEMCQKALADRRGFKVGQMVRCVDATHGAHFLVTGQIYVIDHIQVDDHGHTRLVLRGMARAWSERRFVPERS